MAALNETALLVSFENRIDEDINKQVIALHELLGKRPFDGFIESVPAYASLAVFYNLIVVKKNCKDNTTTFEWVKMVVEELIAGLENDVVAAGAETIRIPVYYNGQDLESLARLHKLSIEDVVQIHTEKIYRVFMIGFLPGFAYMGKLDERIATPRHATPRTNVKAGSVGIAGLQTGIYPMSSPGGWQLIGQTPIKIFDITREKPCLLKAGDKIQFAPISKQEFDNSNEY
ncbi:5-oxoprolinase subunit PxpB [Terrimonas alba]|uniref:5-oxoprolinase subunit PxpB n=1 Tax=Terrimonas alba TaxID=3349636 RepID=UPI0035F2DCE1